MRGCPGGMRVPGLVIPCWRDPPQACGHIHLVQQLDSCHSPGPGSSFAMGTTWRLHQYMIPTRWNTCPSRAFSAPADTSSWNSVRIAVGQLQGWPCVMRVSLLGPNGGPSPIPSLSLPPFHHSPSLPLSSGRGLPLQVCRNPLP